MDEQHKSRAGQASHPAVKTPGEEAQIIQLIIFKLSGEEFGADIDQVREIIRRTVITPVPDSPDFIQGVTNVRGEIAVVINLKSRFFLLSAEGVVERHIIMTQQEQNLFGLMVDEVTEVLRIQRSAIKSVPQLVTRIDRAYVSGVITLKDRLIIMLDLPKVLSEVELHKLNEIGGRHQQMNDRVNVRAEAEETKVSKNNIAVVA